MSIKNEPIYQPLNGKEIRELLKKRTCDRIDKIPYMKEGHAYHEASIIFSFVMTATPADAPVPTAEFMEVAKSPNYNLQEDYKDKVNKATYLKTVREKLITQLAELDEMLELVERKESVEEIISAGRVPDNVRIDNDLPLPRLVTETTAAGGTKKYDKLIDYNNL
jgi:hypothetical protein